MIKKTKVALLYGGKSGEHEISLRSAASVLQHLDHDKYDVIPIAIDKQGCLFVNAYEEMVHYPEQLPVSTNQSQPLASLIHQGKAAVEADVFFPVLHGPLYEDGCIQGIFETISVPYVGCGVLASSIGMDKHMSRKVACDDGIQHTPYISLHMADSNDHQQQQVNAFCGRHPWPFIVKPCTLGSSVGIHKVDNQAALEEAIKDAFRFDHTVLIERFIHGQEVEVAVLEDLDLSQTPNVSTPGEIKVLHKDGFYSYNAKYCQSEQSELYIPAQISANTAERIQQMAASIFNRLQCQGLARVDFFVAAEGIFFNEINTIPGFTSISMYAKLWQHDGLPFAGLLEHLISLAQKHHDLKSNRITNYQ